MALQGYAEPQSNLDGDHLWRSSGSDPSGFGETLQNFIVDGQLQ